MSSIKINKAIYNILSNSSEIRNLVGDNLFPILAPEKTIGSFIIYERKSISTEYSKDGVMYDDVTLEVTCECKDYDESLDIAQAVRDALELVNGTFSGVEILQCRFIDAPEFIGVDFFQQKLHFKIKSK